jgi:small-conductance mechanosensitive channel
MQKNNTAQIDDLSYHLLKIIFWILISKILGYFSFIINDCCPNKTLQRAIMVDIAALAIKFTTHIRLFVCMLFFNSYVAYSSRLDNNKKCSIS